MTNLLFMYPPPLSFYLISLKPQYLSQHPVLKHPQPVFLPQYVLSNFPTKFLIPPSLRTYDITTIIMTRLHAGRLWALDSFSDMRQNVLFTVSSSVLGPDSLLFSCYIRRLLRG